MAIFDYNNSTNVEAIQDALIIDSVNLKSSGDENYVFTGDNGWAILNGETIGYDGAVNKYGAFYGQSLFLSSAECNVLGKYDSEGNLISIGISFWGTGTSSNSSNYLLNTALDGVSDIASAFVDGYADNYVPAAFSNLMSSVAAFAVSQGLSGKDIIISGHSLGGLAVNSMATASANGMWDGFFEDSTYIALASPTQNTVNDKVLNIGYENDPVFRVLDGTSLTTESLVGHDTPRETCTNNIVSFNDTYAGLAGAIDIISIANPASWSAYQGVKYIDGLTRIIDSEIYQYTDTNSNIIVSNLSEAYRETTWVEDLNKSNPHEGSTFIIGTDTNDLLKGSEGNDYLCGGGGDDAFKDNSGYNVIYGGDGYNTYITEAKLSDMSISCDSDGTLFFKYSNNDITRAEDIQSVNGSNLLFSLWGMDIMSTEDFTVSSDGLHGKYSSYNYATSYYANESNSYTIFDTADNSWIFSSGKDAVIHASSNNINIVSGSGNDTIYLSGQGDTLLFYNDFGNDTIYNISESDSLIFMANENVQGDYDYTHFLSTVNDNAVLQFGDSSITLVGINAEALTEMNIVIG